MPLTAQSRGAWVARDQDINSVGLNLALNPALLTKPLWSAVLSLPLVCVSVHAHRGQHLRVVLHSSLSYPVDVVSH